MGDPARAGASDRRRPGDAGPRYRRARGGRLRRGIPAAVPRGDVSQPVRRPDLHPAVGRAPPPWRDDQAQPAPRSRQRQAADRGRRFDRARDDDQADRRAAAQGRRDRGPRPDQRAADLPPVLLRDRHADRDRADRRDPQRARDPRLHRRRHARLPVDPRRARCARAAVRAVLLRLLRRPLSRIPCRTTRPAASSSSRRRWSADDRGEGDRRPRRVPFVRRRCRGRRARRRPHAGACRVDPAAGAGRRARRVRRGDRDPGRLSRSAPGRIDRRGRDQDRDRRRRSTASTRSASTSWPCAPTTSSAAGRSRWPSSTTSQSGRSSPNGSPSWSARSRPAAAMPAARSSAARRPSTRA